MDPKLQNKYHQFQLLHIDDQFELLKASCNDTATVYLSQWKKLVYMLDHQNLYSKPMPWIGMYIAFASLLCILAMVADLLHGFQNRKLWFPCKYFTLNAASLTVIAVAMKLPMDLTNLMPGRVDMTAKYGSMCFMCTMMANLLPSLATMNSKELVANIIALVVLVITLVVNICIQIYTGILDYYEEDNLLLYGSVTYLSDSAYVFCVVLLLMMLIIYVCSSLGILKSKQILESKYQVAHQTTLMDQELQQPGRVLTVEKLKQHVSNYWIMAGTGSPQFMTACSATTSASGVICALSTSLFILSILLLGFAKVGDHKSDYKWSTLVILMIQLIGTILGTIVPVARCLATLRFKLSVKWIWKQVNVCKVESYWTQKLDDWKHSSIPFPSSGRNCKVVIQHMKILILSICIGFQKAFVVSCKMISVIPIFFVICVLCCLRCWKWLKGLFHASRVDSVQNHDEQLGKNKDLSQYVLQLQDDMEFAERTLKGILKSVNHLIRKAEKQQPKHLNKLLAESRGFEGVEKFDSHHVQPLLSEEYLNCWSLPLVTLTTIAMSLPNIQKKLVDGLLIRGVSEGLVYVTLVEESVNATDDHVWIQKTAKTLWVEVEVYHKWLGNKLQSPDSQLHTAGQILQLLRDKAKSMVMEAEGTCIGVSNDNSKRRSISANSMYRITETILLSYHTNIDELSQEELFVQLLLMIADILAACLTNLPQVILRKCHTSAVERREASVQAAAQLLGETTQIINTLQERELPSLNPDELASIDKWRAYLKDRYP